MTPIRTARSRSPFPAQDLARPRTSPRSSSAARAAAPGSPRVPAAGDARSARAEPGRLKSASCRSSRTRGSPTPPLETRGYRNLLLAMDPVINVELSVASSINTGYPLNWTTMLDQVRNKRASDAPPADVYYYGLVKPTDTIQQYCGGGCTAGVGYVANATSASVRVAVGIGFADATSASTMAHELGHNHGRGHAPCGNVAGADAAYPYAGGFLARGLRPALALVLRSQQDHRHHGYCNNKWISDYPYRAHRRAWPA